MRDLDVRRLNDLTDELDRRLKKLENQKSKQDELTLIEESYEGLVFNLNNNGKRISFISKKDSYVALQFEASSSLSNTVNLQIFCNGVLIKEIESAFPIDYQIPIKVSKGENQISLVVINGTSMENYEIDIKFSIQGEIEQKPTVYKLGNALGEYSYLKYGDTAICFNTNTMQTVICKMNKEALGVGFYAGNFIKLLSRDETGTYLERYERGRSVPYKTTQLSEDVGDCEIDINNGVTFLYELKGDSVIMRFVQNGVIIAKEILPIKASKITVFYGTTGRYLCYTDKKGNFTAIRHKSHLSYSPVETISLGKLENANLCEENGVLTVIYKQGLFVMKKPVQSNEEPTLVGFGDEGIISNLGHTIIRQKNNVIKI